MTTALILADARFEHLGPIAEQYFPALLPVLGKPVLQHCIEDLWEAGVREAVVAVPSRGARIREVAGDGSRLGMRLRYLDGDDAQTPGQLLAASGLLQAGQVIVARGDVLRARVAARLLCEARATDAAVVHGTSGARHTGMAIVRENGAQLAGLRWSAARRPAEECAGILVDVGPAEVSYLDDLAGVHRAILQAVEGRFAGLVPDGRATGDGTAALAPGATISRAAQLSGIARLGRRATVHGGVELVGTVDIGDRSVVDRGAQVMDSVVLPDSYVGRGVRVRNSIVAGAWLYRVDLDSYQAVEDPLLLAGRMRAAG